MKNRLVKVLIDGQAWLYANQLRLQAKASGGEVTQDQFEAWQDEWKLQTVKLLEGSEDARVQSEDSN